MTVDRNGRAVKVQDTPQIEAWRTAGFRSKTEMLYAEHLSGLCRVGKVKLFRYEPVRFRLGKGVTYTPDFQVILPDGSVEYHEVKGAFIREDARVKFRVIATVYPELTFELVQWRNGYWMVVEHHAGRAHG